MPRKSKKYVDTVQVQLRLPVGIYEEMLHIMNVEKKWNSPQQFIQDMINEGIGRWKIENPEKG